MTTSLPPLFSCEFCGTRVDPDGVGVFKRVTGWVQNKRGGHNGSISLPIPVGGLCCRLCMDLMKHGISPDQEKLF